MCSLLDSVVTEVIANAKRMQDAFLSQTTLRMTELLAVLEDTSQEARSVMYDGNNFVVMDMEADKVTSESQTSRQALIDTMKKELRRVSSCGALYLILNPRCKQCGGEVYRNGEQALERKHMTEINTSVAQGFLVIAKNDSA